MSERDLAEAICTASCGHTEAISLSAWLRGEQFKHCGTAMRVIVSDQEQAAEAIQAALDDGIEPYEITARLAEGGITDVPAKEQRVGSRQNAGASIAGDADELTRQLARQLGGPADPQPAPPGPLKLWAAQATLRLAEQLRGHDYSVVVTSGPLADQSDGIAITLIAAGESETVLARAVFRTPPIAPGPAWDEWLSGKIDQLRSILTD